MLFRSDKCNINNGKCYDRFRVAKIAIENKRIVGIRIVNESMGDKVAFSWAEDK